MRKEAIEGDSARNGMNGVNRTYVVYTFDGETYSPEDPDVPSCNCQILAFVNAPSKGKAVSLCMAKVGRASEYSSYQAEELAETRPDSDVAAVYEGR